MAWRPRTPLWPQGLGDRADREPGPRSHVGGRARTPAPRGAGARCLPPAASLQLQLEKHKGEILGVVVVESGWGSILPTVILANMMNGGPAARSGKLSIGDQITSVNGTSLVGLPLATCQSIIKVGPPPRLSPLPFRPHVTWSLSRDPPESVPHPEVPAGPWWGGHVWFHTARGPRTLTPRGGRAPWWTETDLSSLPGTPPG